MPLIFFFPSWTKQLLLGIVWGGIQNVSFSGIFFFLCRHKQSIIGKIISNRFSILNVLSIPRVLSGPPSFLVFFFWWRRASCEPFVVSSVIPHHLILLVSARHKKMALKEADGDDPKKFSQKYWLKSKGNIFSMFWEYTINNVCGRIAIKKVAEHFLRQESFVRDALTKAWLCGKFCFFSPLRFVT